MLTIELLDRVCVDIYE